MHVSAIQTQEDVFFRFEKYGKWNDRFRKQRKWKGVRFKKLELGIRDFDIFWNIIKGLNDECEWLRSIATLEFKYFLISSLIVKATSKSIAGVRRESKNSLMNHRF